jgi:hypothetical protein
MASVSFESLKEGSMYLMTSGDEGYLVRVGDKVGDIVGIIYKGITSGRAVVKRMNDGTLEVGVIEEGTGNKIWVPVQFQEVSQSGGRRSTRRHRRRHSRKRHSRKHI